MRIKVFSLSLSTTSYCSILYKQGFPSYHLYNEIIYNHTIQKSEHMCKPWYKQEIGWKRVEVRGWGREKRGDTFLPKWKWIVLCSSQALIDFIMFYPKQAKLPFYHPNYQIIGNHTIQKSEHMAQAECKQERG